jgi:CRP/FNR family transcriptional regulator
MQSKIMQNALHFPDKNGKSCYICSMQLRKDSPAISPWICTDLSTWGDITQGLTPWEYHKDGFLFHQGDDAEYVYIIKTGRVRMVTFQADGGERHLYIAERGSIFGEIDCLSGTPHSTSAIAIVDTTAYRLSYRELEERMHRDWAFNKKMMQLICQKSHIFIKQIFELSSEQAVQRIARTLLNIASQYGKPHKDGIYITIKFTQQDVSHIVNMSRVTVCNAFSLFAENGVLHKTDGHYIIKDMHKLKTYSADTVGA